MINNANPFLGVYKMPKKSPMTGMGFGGGQPEPFLSSEEVIGNPDAQNTAQRSKSTASSLKDAYEAVSSGKFSPEQQQMVEGSMKDSEKRYSSTLKAGIPFVPKKIQDLYKLSQTFDRPLTPQERELIVQNFPEIDAYRDMYEKTPQGMMEANKRMQLQPGKSKYNFTLAPMGESKTMGQEPQTSTLTAHKWQEYDEHGNLQWRTSGLTAKEAFQREQAQKISLVYR
jgi:hypothetical protein